MWWPRNAVKGKQITETEMVESPPTMKTPTMFCHLPKRLQMNDGVWLKKLFSRHTEAIKPVKFLTLDMNK